MTPLPDDGAVEPSGQVALPASFTLPALLSDCVSHAGDRPALVAGAARMTYRELGEASERAAMALRSIGVGPGDRLALLAPNVAEWIPIAFGALTLGATVEAFNTWVKAYDLDYLLRVSGVSTLVLQDRVKNAHLVGELLELLPALGTARPGEWHRDRFPGLQNVVVLDDAEAEGALMWSALVEDASGDARAVVPCGGEAADEGDGTAFVLYTSGSTKNPKAVPLRHRDMIVNGFHIGERMGLTPDDRIWFGSPLFWSFGCANALMATMTHRACLVLQETFEPEAAAELMAREKVTAAYLLPAMSEAFARTCAEQMRDIPSLRTGLTIGRPEEVERVAVTLGIAEICNVYGSTENYGNCCVTDHRMPLAQRLVTQGHPLPGVEVRIVDEESGAPLAPGESGEAQVRGRVTTGYLNDQEANAAAFTEDGWYRSGDRLVLNQDGTVTFVDRISDMIKTSGINVSPAEVESFISDHPDVLDVVVVGGPHLGRGEVVVAFVVPGSPDLTASDVIEYCKGSIAGYKVPRAVSIVDRLPRTGTGKIVRRDLRGAAEELVAAQHDGGTPR